MREDQKSYFRQRAAEELDAARRASCVEAASVHQALAEGYLALVADEDVMPVPRPGLAERLSTVA